MRPATLIFLWGACLYGQAGSIEGVAVNRSDGQPLPGVHVRLYLIAAGGQGVSDAYGAISDKAGHFSIATIKPGSYLLAPDFPGFLHVPPKSSSPIPAIQIKPGQKLEGFRLEMTRQAVLSGRVVDEFGDPVSDVSVQLTPATPDDATVNLFGNQNPRTDDRGEFRAVTAPGKFYLKAQPGSNGNDLPEIRTDGSSDAGYGSTFYPSAASQDRATAIQATAGGDTGGLEIRLIRQHTLSISGIVTGMPDTSARAIVTVRWGENVQQLYQGISLTADANGRFTRAHLTPGFYRLSARFVSGNVQLQSSTVDVKLDTANESNVELALNGGSDLTGTLEVTGLPAEKRSVRLQTAENFMAFATPPLSGDAGSDGGFKIANVPPGKYKVSVEPLGDNGYVKTLLLDGAAADGGVLDLSHGVRGSRIKVVASAGAGQLSGKVLDKDGQPIANSVTVVVLMQDPKVMNEDAITRVTSSDGSYSRKGITPGKYRLFALDIFHYVGAQGMQSNDFSEAYSRGEEIEIKEGDKIVKDIKVLEKEDADGKRQ